MFDILFALVGHSARIMTFNHDGRGLPQNRGGGLYMALLTMAVTSLFKEVTDPVEVFSFFNWVTTTVASLGLMLFIIRPFPLSIVALTITFGNLLLGVVHLTYGALPSFAPYLFLAWEMAAAMVVISKFISRNGQSSKSSKN